MYVYHRVNINIFFLKSYKMSSERNRINTELEDTQLLKNIPPCVQFPKFFLNLFSLTKIFGHICIAGQVSKNAVQKCM